MSCILSALIDGIISIQMVFLNEEDDASPNEAMPKNTRHGTQG
jgi:hypothetical protein